MTFLLRAQYEIDSIPDTEVKDIRMDTATTVNTGRGQSVYIEECRCPKGYSGLSCEVNYYKPCAICSHVTQSIRLL